MLKSFVISLLLPVILLAATSARAFADSYDVYLLAGQSNMDGRGKAAELSEEQRQPMERALIYYRNPPTSSEGWKPLAPGFSMPPGYKGGLPSKCFGPELGFAAALLAARPELRLALIKGAKGGTSIEEWKPGAKDEPASQGPCYRAFIATIAQASEALTKDGHTFAIRGLLWHQGEANAKDSAEDYQAKLTALIARLREDVKQPELPVLIGEVYDNGKRDRVRSAQKSIVGAIPHLAFASAEGLVTQDNGTHFDAKSQLLLGQRFAGALLTLGK